MSYLAIYTKVACKFSHTTNTDDISSETTAFYLLAHCNTRSPKPEAINTK